jgi:7-carboxy-7-deazaguanine synthase
MLKVNEIFYSIQGEGTSAGLPCIFIRLTYCNLRCSYCDTDYAFNEGSNYSIQQILEEIENYKCNLVEVTGGEPLLQKETIELLKILCDKGYSVLLETSGSLPIGGIDDRVKIIMDLKCPSSNMSDKNDYENLVCLKKSDEVKFVIGNRIDYNWAKEQITRYNLIGKVNLLISPVFEKIKLEELVNWILEDRLQVRFQIQLHKYIWHADKRGV